MSINAIAIGKFIVKILLTFVLICTVLSVLDVTTGIGKTGKIIEKIVDIAGLVCFVAFVILICIGIAMGAYAIWTVW